MLRTYESHDAGILWKIDKMFYKIRKTISRRMRQRASDYGTGVHKVDRGSMVNTDRTIY